MGAFDTTTTVTDGVTDNLAQYHNELKTAIDHVMSAAAYAAYCTPASMTGNVTLTDASLPILSYAPTAARDLTLPVVATTNHAFYVINRSGTYAITVKDAAAATITTVAINATTFLVSDGANSWYPMGGGALTKAAASDVTTGTDDAKYVTALAIKNSVNVPNVAPVTDGHVMTVVSGAWTSAAGGGGGDKYPMEARLTLETGVPISTTDQTAKTTLYLTKYKGDQIVVYSGTAWSTIALGADISITLASLTAGLPYDVYVYNNAGTLTLELTAWTNTTTRATALTTQNGVYVKTGATTRRYIGTICIQATGQCEDSSARRLIWNYYNRAQKVCYGVDTTNSWAYTTATFRAANNNTTDGVGRVAVVVGIGEDSVEGRRIFAARNGTVGTFFAGGVGIDSTSIDSCLIKGYGVAQVANIPNQVESIYVGILSAGYHYIQALEYSFASGTTTWSGDEGTTQIQTGLIVKVWC
jgi:hypothetical protein